MAYATLQAQTSTHSWQDDLKPIGTDEDEWVRDQQLRGNQVDKEDYDEDLLISGLG
jgi:hypothetical protein